MVESASTRGTLTDVSKSISVAVPPDEAFRIFVERPIEWLPAGHTFIRNPQAVTLQSWAGGCFVEHGADGTEVVRGTIVECQPPSRLVMTWRVGADWRPVHDDEKASRIQVEFVATGPHTTNVILTHTELYRHGDAAAAIRSAVDGAGPGDTLKAYARVVARHANQR
ncbi:SRPBCC domain-containing protein [Actinoplanes sp. NPDC051411]|uniref:SRPBCC domain-containing protein n=1 Tax=Actinoplanes sp. NPDC051411 TaxID=3155522 RepID=UPI00342558F2